MEKIKTVYGYDKLTGECIGEIPAHLCPVTKSSYNMPANSTEIKPLPEKEGFAIFFNAGIWNYIEDNRGKKIYSTKSGQEVGLINNLHAMLTDEFTTLAPIDGGIWMNGSWELVPFTEDEILAKARNEVFAKRNKARGSLAEQWEFFLDNGYDAAKAKDDAIKLKHPKKIAK